MRRAVTTVGVVALLGVAAGVAVPAVAGPNRCAVAPPTRPPASQNPLGSQWFDGEGGGLAGPQESVFGHVYGDQRHIEANAFANNSAQGYLGTDRQCLAVGDVQAGVPAAVGEFPVEPAPAIVSMPWLRRDGTLFRAPDGRTILLRGMDWPYNEEIFQRPYNLTEDDFARLESWGVNLLRVRIAGYRSGYWPNTAAEPGYWEHLDQLIAAANRHGIYVLPATVTGDAESLRTDKGHERLKFVAGSANQAWWLAFQGRVFARYRDWPGVVGFDTMNEDDSYPPFVHDRFMMGPAHQAIDTVLRSGDDRHVYFQEPSGWSYWGAEYWPGMMNGVDIGDPNRFFCPKWKAGGDSGLDLDTKAQLAAQSNAPLFMCEVWVDKDNGTDAQLIAKQRDVLTAMDARLIGGVRVLYGPSDGYGTQTSAGQEAAWVQEFVRPYPMWAGGRITSVHYDFDVRRLDLGLALDGSGPTEVFVPQARTYTDGFVATSTNGGRLVHDGAGVVEAVGMSWDAARERLTLPAGTGSVTVTAVPR